MLILPTSNAALAKRFLGQVADSRTKVALIVMGGDERAQEIASRADVRAEGHPFRRVVLVPEPAVLEGDERFATLLEKAAGHDVVAMTLKFEVSSRLRGPAARDFAELEMAFARALMGTVSP